MSEYAIFDGDGFPIGFYHEALHGVLGEPDSTIPIDAVPITTQQWQELLAHPGKRKWQDGQVVPCDPPKPEASGAYRLYKSVFVERMTPAEAEALEGALASETAKLRQMFNAVEYFVSDDSLFAYLHWIVASTLGSEAAPDIDRADELLAPVQ